MKDLSTLILENLVNEASQYKPKFKPQDWAKALKELNKDSAGNYSQLRGMEGLLEGRWGDSDYETADEWVEELYDDGEFDSKYEFKDIITDIANFFAENYEKSDADYGDSQDTIYYWKRDMTDCDFGVEEENWYKFYEYTGPSSMKKYAKEIAKVGDCSYMDDMDELAEWYD